MAYRSSRDHKETVHFVDARPTRASHGPSSRRTEARRIDGKRGTRSRRLGALHAAAGPERYGRTFGNADSELQPTNIRRLVCWTYAQTRGERGLACDDPPVPVGEDFVASNRD